MVGMFSSGYDANRLGIFNLQNNPAFYYIWAGRKSKRDEKSIKTSYKGII